MDNNTLYRKYRPTTFDDVVGQDWIVRTLKNQIKQNIVSHAYLFCGTRGTGKTTIAKILARSLNCENKKDGNPCNECKNCVASLEGTDLNIYEMDAASNRGINDIRGLKDLVEYPPQNGEKYKIFIIDEAHMLSREAFNSFLKLLEEPPSYVVFILATTNPNKILETIISRCQRYDFKRINIETISNYLKTICKKENINIDDDALIFISEKSDGSMRESLSKLDRCRAYSPNERITKEDIINILGIIDDDDYDKLVKAINCQNVKEVLRIVENVVLKGKDLSLFITDLIWYLRNVLLSKELDHGNEYLNITEENFKKYKKASEDITKNTIIFFIEELSKASNQMKYEENKRVLLETTLIRLASPETYIMDESLISRIEKIEQKLSENTYVKMEVKNEDNNILDIEKTENIKKENTKKIEDEKISIIEVSEATYEEIKKVIEDFKIIISNLDPLPKTLLKNAKLIPGDKETPGIIDVLLPSYEYGLLKDKSIENILKESARKIYGKDINFRFKNNSNEKYVENPEIVLKDLKKTINMEIKEI